MKLNTNATRSLLFFVFGAIVIALLAPHERKFKYTFTLGKPWPYELLTAPYDFHIMKTDDRIKAEQDSVLKSLVPYYVMSDVESRRALGAFKNDCEARLRNKSKSANYESIYKTLETVYHAGIISDEELDSLKSSGRTEVNLENTDHVISLVPISRFYTVKEAYLLVQNAISAIGRQALSGVDLSLYLRVNVQYSAAMTGDVRDEELQNIPLSTGVVQVGERIVDKGDIVDSRTYNILDSFRREFDKRSGNAIDRVLVLAGTLVMMLALFVMFWLYLSIFRKRYLSELRNTIFIGILMLLLVVVTELSVGWHLFNIYIVPFAMLPIMTRTFFDSRTAMFAHIVCILAASLFVPYALQFILIQVLAGMVAIFSLSSFSSRISLIRTTFFVFLTYAVLYPVFNVWQDGKLSSGDWLYALYFGINLIFLMFTYLLVYLAERLFGYVSIISLVELSDMNSPLLKELSEVAPGTFQHSMQVSILATEAARRLGGDVQLVRTGALYHDIGKMKNPSFFTENQGTINPHEGLSYEESARIIIRHVTDGIALAQRYNLPSVVTDFIRTHHGRGITAYFYNSYCNSHPEETVDIAPFSYPGPNPFTKETAILMLADSVEASSRSLKEYTENSIRTLVERIVDGIVSSGLLNEAPITFRDVQTVKSVFIEKLEIMYHSRTAYPERRSLTR